MDDSITDDIGRLERPPRCQKARVAAFADMECTQNVTLNPLAYRDEEEQVFIENGRGDMGISGNSKKERLFYNPGSTCSVSCQKGFKLVGDTVLTCENNGQWSGEPATCIRNFNFIYYLFLNVLKMFIIV